jgi:hypothetical protein
VNQEKSLDLKKKNVPYTIRYFDTNPPHIISDHYKSKNINIDDLLFIEGCVNKKIKKYMESLES